MSAYVTYCQCRLGPPHVWQPDGGCRPVRGDLADALIATGRVHVDGEEDPR